MEGEDPVASFLAVTGATEAEAMQMLEATNYSLQDAVELFFAAGCGDPGGVDQPALLLPADAEEPGRPGDDEDEALARRLPQDFNAAAAGAGPFGPGGQPFAQDHAAEDQVRAPIPTRTERLYGEDFAAAAGRLARRGGAAANAVPTSMVDAFRDFRAEEEGGPSGVTTGGLASLFEPPREILFTGSFEEAKAAAADQGRWLIVNLQSSSHFASHQLNRDTWGEPTLRALVESNFVLLQAYDVSEEGQKLLNFYQVYQIPAILVVDPVTGAPMRKWAGFVTAERLGEELLPFLDTSFSDPGASRLAASLKRKMQGPPSRQASGDLSSGAAGSGGVDAASSKAPYNEDEELQRALAASAADAAGTSTGAIQQKQPQPASQQGTEEGAAGAEEAGAAGGASLSSTASEVAAKAAAGLPEEPTSGAGCRIGLRFPDGTRAQRRFPLDAPLQAVRDWCLSAEKGLQAAAGRPFVLSEAFPGARPLADLSATVAAAGVANSTLVMTWSS